MLLGGTWCSKARISGGGVLRRGRMDKYAGVLGGGVTGRGGGVFSWFAGREGGG